MLSDTARSQAMISNARHTQSIGKKYSYVFDSVQRHEARTIGTQSRVGRGISLPASCQGPARKTGYCLPSPSCSRLRSWMLLARPFMPEGQNSSAEQRLLAGEIRHEQATGSAKRAAPPARRLVSDNSVGMLVVNERTAERNNRQAARYFGKETGAKCLTDWQFVPQNASIYSGGVAILGADSHRQTRDAGGCESARGIEALAEIISSPHMDNQALPAHPTFIDLFSGCGGLSLGLSQAGWKGLFAIERATDAFETFQANFLGEDPRHRFEWPAWLPQSAHSIDEVLEAHHGELKKLRNKVDLIAGGPPCQGFSFAGKRNSSDPRNKMFQRYVSFVELINPKFLILENVPGMNVAHTKRGNKTARVGQTYYDKLRDALGELGLGYNVGAMILDAANFGVPQRRSRLVVIGIRSDMAKKFPTGCTGIFDSIDIEGRKQLLKLGNGKPVTAQQAISDLVVGTGKQAQERTIEYTGFGARRGYVQLKYEGTHGTAYQKLMNTGVARSKMDSMRVAHHREDVAARFQEILKTSRRGVNLSSDDRERFGMLKHRTVPMAPTQPAPTLTTLPDDILHYSDPRILTVRECARLQSFPDSFAFRGKYTTGGDRRKVECPRYTQVGNAVPPLLALAIGAGILGAWKAIEIKANGGIGKKTIFKRQSALAR